MSKNKRVSSRKKSNNGPLRYIFIYNLYRPSSTKTKHRRKNESLYLEKVKSKENTMRHDDLKVKKKQKNTKNNSKSYIKINDFEKIIDTLRKGKNSKDRMKDLSKIDYTLNKDKNISLKIKNNNLLN